MSSGHDALSKIHPSGDEATAEEAGAAAAGAGLDEQGTRIESY